MRGATRALVAVVFLAAAAAGAGCGESKLDTSALESEIESALEDRTGAAVSSVECPDDVEAKEGESFRCTATARSERVAIDVTQRDSEGSVTWRVARR